MKHILFKRGDVGAPDAIKDRNDDIVLSMCRICGKAESQLDEPCAFEYPNPDESPLERELSVLIAKHIMWWTLSPRNIELVRTVAREFRALKL